MSTLTVKSNALPASLRLALWLVSGLAAGAFIWWFSNRLVVSRHFFEIARPPLIMLLCMFALVVSGIIRERRAYARGVRDGQAGQADLPASFSSSHHDDAR